MSMDVVILSRIQFAVNTIFHFLFVPLTIGLSIYVAVFETIAYVKKDKLYEKLARFFGTLFIINYAVGVVTGIVQEFQFGMNWSGYSRYVGDVFGAPLAIEALSAFFLESTFLGVWVFGKDRLSKRTQAISIWLVAIASNISAYWIIVANSFMQEPVGYKIEGNRAVMTDFIALITSHHALLQFFHVFTAALVTASCFVIGVSAYKILKNHQKQLFALSFKISIVVCIFSVGAVAMAGDLQGKYVVKTQPMKMAAMEGLYESEESASFSIIAGIDEKNEEKTFALSVPYLLSFLATGDIHAKVEGIKDLQAEYEKQYGEGNYVPPVTLVFWSFRFMVGMAGLMLLICIIGLVLFKKKKFMDKKWFLRLSILMIFLPYISNSSGWIVTEVGRQPWIVYGLLSVKKAVSTNITTGAVWFSLVGFTLLYTVITIVTVLLMIKTIKKESKEVEA